MVEQGIVSTSSMGDVGPSVTPRTTGSRTTDPHLATTVQ